MGIPAVLLRRLVSWLGELHASCSLQQQPKSKQQTAAKDGRRDEVLSDGARPLSGAAAACREQPVYLQVHLGTTPHHSALLESPS